MHTSTQGPDRFPCRLQVRYPTRPVPGQITLSKGSQGLILSWWPNHMLGDGDDDDDDDDDEEDNDEEEATA